VSEIARSAEEVEAEPSQPTTSQRFQNELVLSETALFQAFCRAVDLPAVR
jgi:hypothetical protein